MCCLHCIGALEKVHWVALKQSGEDKSKDVKAWHCRRWCIALGLPFLHDLYKGKYNCLCSEKNISFFLSSFQVNSVTKKKSLTFQQPTSQPKQNTQLNEKLASLLKILAYDLCPVNLEGLPGGKKGPSYIYFRYLRAGGNKKEGNRGNSVVTGKKLTLKRNYFGIQELTAKTLSSVGT